MTPLDTLWQEIARRYGPEVAAELHEVYRAAVRSEVRQRRKCGIAADAPKQRVGRKP